MNQMRLVPKKDYVANRLVSGALQLARNTSLFLDETQLEQGQLDTTGEARVERINSAVSANANRVGSVCVVQVCETSRPWGT